MSSSETLRPFDLLDLRQAPPGPARPAFEARTTFDALPGSPLPVSLEDAYQKGLAEGEQLGRSASMKELVPVVEALAEVARAVTDVRGRRLADLESELVDVACEVARRILHGELETPGDTALRMARAAIGTAADEKNLVLHVSPQDLELIRTHAVELEQELVEQSLTFVADPAMPVGGVVLETPTRCIEGRPERALAAYQERAQLASEHEAATASTEDPA